MTKRRADNVGRELRSVALFLAVLLTACQSASESSASPSASGTGSTAAGAAPNGSGGPAGTDPGMTQLPPEIVASVDAIMTASTADAATAATRKVLEMSGVVIADDDAGHTGSPARVYLTTLQLEAIALEAQQRDTLSRVSFEDWATAFAGVAGLPAASGLGPPAQAGALRTKIVDQPFRLATFMTAWVKLALEYHRSSDPQEAALTNAPLLFAALAQRDEVDVAQPFFASDLRLGPLDVAVLTAGLRETLLAAVIEVPASPAPSASASPSASARLSASPGPSSGPSASPSATDRPSATATPSASAHTASPSASPHALGGSGGRVAAVSPLDPVTRLPAEGDTSACAGLAEQLAGIAPGVADGSAWALGTGIKAYVAKYVGELLEKARVGGEEALGTLFEVAGILLRLHALVLFYQSVEVKTELSPDSLHKGIDTKASVTAKITAGVPDAKWEKLQQERESSGIGAKVRDCFKVLGLPVLGSLADIPDQMKNWRAAWNMKDPGDNAEFPIQQFDSGPGSVLGRLERPLKAVNDHSASDEVTVLVRPEKTVDHPGLAKTARVRICNEVRSNEPPNIGLILNPALSGSGAVGVLTASAKKVAGKTSLISPSGLASLVATIVDLLAAWVQFSNTLKSCATLRVGYHEPQPGQWNGTVTIASEFESEQHSTEITPNQCVRVCSPDQNVRTSVERTAIRHTTTLRVSGTEPAAQPGAGRSLGVSLMGSSQLSGSNTFVSVGTFEGLTASGCETTEANSRYYNGTFTVPADNARVGVQFDASGKYALTYSGGNATGPVPMVPGRIASVTESHTRGCVPGTSSSRADSVPIRTVGAGPAVIEGQIDPKNPPSRITGSITVFNEADGSSSRISWDLRRVGSIRLPSP